MKIIICDVGNAASAFVVGNSGYVMMIDCGSSSLKTNPIEVFTSNKEWLGARPYVDQYGISYPVALLHVTHPDDDHVRNAENVKRLLRPFLVYRTYSERFPDRDGINKDYVNQIDKAYRTKVTETIDWGFQVNETRCISVENCMNDNTLSIKVRNNSSIVRYIKEDGVGILFCGDLEKAGWERLLSDNPQFSGILKNEGVNILVAPHHGHKSGFPKSLFDLIGSVDVVIHSKDSEAGKEGTDVSSQYPNFANGKMYNPLDDDNYMYHGKVLTTRSNGHIYIATNVGGYTSYRIWTSKGSPNHVKYPKVK